MANSRQKPKIGKWVLAPHAAQRMSERKISVDELQNLIDEPDEIIPQGPKWIFAKKFKNRTDNLVAAVLLERKEHNLWVVLTLMVNFQKTKRR